MGSKNTLCLHKNIYVCSYGKVYSWFEKAFRNTTATQRKKSTYIEWNCTEWMCDRGGISKWFEYGNEFFFYYSEAPECFHIFCIIRKSEIFITTCGQSNWNRIIEIGRYTVGTHTFCIYIIQMALLIKKNESWVGFDLWIWRRISIFKMFRFAL